MASNTLHLRQMDAPSSDEAKLQETESEYKEVGRDALFEIECMADTAMKVIRELDQTGSEYVVARGMLKRISDLSDIAFHAFVIEPEQRESLRQLKKNLNEF